MLRLVDGSQECGSDRYTPSVFDLDHHSVGGVAGMLLPGMMNSLG